MDFERLKKATQSLLGVSKKNKLLNARSNQPDLFSGLNRMEVIAEKNGVKYINDAFSSSPEETFNSINSIKEPVIWIVGGFVQGLNYKVLEEIVKDKVSSIVCSGADNDKVFEYFFEWNDMIIHAKDISEAVILSSLFAKSGNVVLFSPACPAYMTNATNEERGDEFRKSVRQLSK